MFKTSPENEMLKSWEIGLNLHSLLILKTNLLAEKPCQVQTLTVREDFLTMYEAISIQVDVLLTKYI